MFVRDTPFHSHVQERGGHFVRWVDTEVTGAVSPREMLSIYTGKLPIGGAAAPSVIASVASMFPQS